MDFFFAERMRRFGKTIERRLHQGAGVPWRSSRIEAHQASVGIGPMERIDRISETTFFAHFLKETRGHAAASRRGEDMRGVVIGIMRGAALEADDDMGLAQTFLGETLAAAIMRRGRCWRLATP